MTNKVTDNRNAVEKAIDWLEAGAPHINLEGSGLTLLGLDMNEGIAWEDRGCGTTCCIAGAIVEFYDPYEVATLVNSEYNSVFQDNLPFYDVESKAYKIVFGEDGEDKRKGDVLRPLFFAHELYGFDGDPKVAAEMLRKVIEARDSGKELTRDVVATIVEAVIVIEEAGDDN